MQQSDSEATFFGQLRHFGESTSVRGVPRALKSNDRVLAILWSLAVVLCAGLLLWQVSTVFIRYYQYNVVTSVTEANYETVFPDVTICKVAQLNALYTSTLNYSRYISDTLARRDRWPFSRVKLFMPNTTQSTYNAVWRYFLSKEGYYNSLPRDFHGMDNQESLDNPILINCHAILGHSVLNVDCARFVQISWHRRYSKCLVLDLPDSLRTAVQSISVVLYLNDFHQPAARDGCCPNEMRSQSSGVRISIQEHGVISDMMRGLAVAPGVETTVVFEDKVRQRLNEPYGDCTTRTRLGDPEDNLSYSVPGCKQLCVQKVNIEECGCIELQNGYTFSQLLSVNGSICGNQTSANDIGHENQAPEDDLRPFETLYCVFERNDSFAEKCPCPPPCKERSYEIMSSASDPWPHPVFQQDFFTLFIRNSKFAHKFQAYEDIVSAFENKSISSVGIEVA